VGKAESDYRIAKQISRNKVPEHDGVCFHCQQCAEKYLKALLEELAVTSPKTHNLMHLLTLLLPHHASLRSLGRGLIFLTAFAVDIRLSRRKRQQAPGRRGAAMGGPRKAHGTNGIGNMRLSRACTVQPKDPRPRFCPARGASTNDPARDVEESDEERALGDRSGRRRHVTAFLLNLPRPCISDLQHAVEFLMIAKQRIKPFLAATHLFGISGP
jgi:hypothetical protein